MDEETLITIIVVVVAGVLLIAVTVVIVLVVVCRRRRRPGHASQTNRGFSNGSQTDVNENISSKHTKVVGQGSITDASLLSERNRSLDMTGDLRFSAQVSERNLNELKSHSSQDKHLDISTMSSEPNILNSVASNDLIYASTDVAMATIGNHEYPTVNKRSMNGTVNRGHGEACINTQQHYSVLRNTVKTFENPYNVMHMNGHSVMHNDVRNVEVDEYDDSCSDASPYAIIDVVREATQTYDTNLINKNMTQCEADVFKQGITCAEGTEAEEFSQRHANGVRPMISTKRPMDDSDKIESSDDIYYELEPKMESSDSDSDESEETCV